MITFEQLLRRLDESDRSSFVPAQRVCSVYLDPFLKRRLQVHSVSEAEITIVKAM